MAPVAGQTSYAMDLYDLCVYDRFIMIAGLCSIYAIKFVVLHKGLKAELI